VPLPAARCLTPDLLRRRRHDAGEAIATAIEALRRERVEPLLHALDGGADALLPAPAVTLHGDLHRRNLLLTSDDRLALIDLDSVRRGPAALELGGWIAEAMFLALLDGKPAHSAAPQWRAMLGAYAQAAGTALPGEAELAWATAQQLLEQRAYRCVANLKPGRLALVPVLLRAAEAIARERTLDAAEAAVEALGA
jgi:aminoglycoside phosphotransferase (APT) family kinase protein